ncbi:MAG: hypothetical protein FIB01_04765 [Gemmatimonadetes bacterium]|nr:hypothetical protein [Gemmatimonadota bacterium]
MSDERIPVRLLFADGGSFHELVVQLPAAAVARHERLIDALREDPEINGRLFVHPRRLVAAFREQAD